MKSYKQFLVEASGKNLHMEHLEDEVLNGGVNGTRGAINFLRSLRDMLAGNNREAVNVTVKWDGAPAICAGIHPNGKFFVDYKSMRRPCFTQSDIDEHFVGSPLHPKMSALLEHLPKLNIPGNIFQGDVLWTTTKRLYFFQTKQDRIRNIISKIILLKHDREKTTKILDFRTYQTTL